MKKFGLKTLLIGVFLLSVSTVSAASPIRIILNGEILATDVAPKIENGRVLVPIGTIAKALNAVVNWDNEKKKVEIQTTANVWEGNLAQNINWSPIRNMITQYINGFDLRDADIVGPLRAKNFDSNVIGPEVVVPNGGLYPSVLDIIFIDAKQDKNFEVTVRVATVKEIGGLTKQYLDFVLEPARGNSEFGYLIKGIWLIKEEKLDSYTLFSGQTFVQNSK